MPFFFKNSSRVRLNGAVGSTASCATNVWILAQLVVSSLRIPLPANVSCATLGYCNVIPAPGFTPAQFWLTSAAPMSTDQTLETCQDIWIIKKKKRKGREKEREKQRKKKPSPWIHYSCLAFTIGKAYSVFFSRILWLSWHKLREIG